MVMCHSYVKNIHRGSSHPQNKKLVNYPHIFFYHRDERPVAVAGISHEISPGNSDETQPNLVALGAPTSWSIPIHRLRFQPTQATGIVINDGACGFLKAGTSHRKSRDFSNGSQVRYLTQMRKFMVWFPPGNHDLEYGKSWKIPPVLFDGFPPKKMPKKRCETRNPGW